MKNKSESKGKDKKPRREKPQNVQFKVKQETELMKFLEENMPHKNRNNIKTMLKKKQVLVNGTAISQFNHLLKPGNTVELSRRPVKSSQEMKGFVIVHEDKDLIVVNKNAGVYAVPTEREKQNTVFNMLSTYIKGQDKDSRIYTIQPIDRETSGLMVFGKSKEVQEEMKHGNFDRTYLAVIDGQMDPAEAEYSSWLHLTKNFITVSSQDQDNGVEATTHYSTLKNNDAFSLLRLKPKTSFKNQVRVHLKDLGHPVLGDKKFGSRNNPIGRLCLHAAEITFLHPANGKRLHFKTSVPSSFQKLV